MPVEPTSTVSTGSQMSSNILGFWSMLHTGQGIKRWTETKIKMSEDTLVVLKVLPFYFLAFCPEMQKKMYSHAQIRPQGGEKQLSKVRVGRWYAAKHQYSYCIEIELTIACQHNTTQCNIYIFIRLQLQELQVSPSRTTEPREGASPLAAWKTHQQLETVQLPIIYDPNENFFLLK